MMKTQNYWQCIFARRFIVFAWLVFFFFWLQADWTPEVRLTDNSWASTTTSGNQNALAIDGSGNIYGVWLDNRDHNGSVYEVYFKCNSALSGWGPDTRLTFEAIVGADENGKPVFESQGKATPGLVVDSRGNVFVYYENTATRKVEVISGSVITASWNFLPTVIGDGGASGANPVLAADMNDNLHAVWRKFSDGIPQVCYRQYSPDSGWGLVEQLTSFPSVKLTPFITVDSSGNLHLAWSDGRDTVGSARFEIYYKEKPVSGEWSPDFRVSFALSSDSLTPHLASDAGGNIHLVWADDREGNFEIYYCRRSGSSGQWETEECLTTRDAVSVNPRIAIDARGQLHVIWEQGLYPGARGGDQYSMYAKKKSISWGDDTRIAGKGWRGSILAAPDSVLHVVYAARPEGIPGPEIFYRKFDPLLISSPRPREVLLALDVSGSMGWLEDGGQPVVPGDSRLGKVTRAVSSFLDHLGMRNPADTHFGLVTFPRPSTFCPSAANIISGSAKLVPMNDANRQNLIETILPGLRAGGGTPMAEGLTLADALFTSHSENKILLLVSDGGHNCPSHVFPPGFFSSFSGPVYPVGVGTSGEVQISRLRDIAQLSGGEFLDATVTSSLNLTSWFGAIYQSLLGLESETVLSGQIQKDENKQHQVSVTEHDTEIAFHLAWTTPNEKCLDFKLKTPEGQVIDSDSVSSFPGMVRVSRDTYQIIYLKDEFLKTTNRAGQWIMELKGNEIEADAEETYFYWISMDSRLKLLTEFDRNRYFAGESVGIQVVVLEDQEYRPAEVKITVTSPRQSFGNWMGQHSVNILDLKKTPAMMDDEPLTDLERKSRFLLEKLRKPFDAEMEKTVYLLLDRETNGDLKAGDRVYTTLIHNTRTPGTYVFDIVAQGMTVSGQPFRREKIIQKYLGVRVSQKQTQIRLEEAESNQPEIREFRLSIFPRDPQGNYLGPGFSDRIRFFIPGATFLETVRDHLDGHYSQHFQIPLSQIPDHLFIKIRILDVDVVFYL